MASKRLISGSLLIPCLLCVCGSAASDESGSAGSEQTSARAAEIILADVTAATGARNRGLVPRSDLTGFHWSEVPCILLEMGFLSNTQDDALLATNDYRQKIAQSITSGVCRWVDSGR